MFFFVQRSRDDFRFSKNKKKIWKEGLCLTRIQYLISLKVNTCSKPFNWGCNSGIVCPAVNILVFRCSLCTPFATECSPSIGVLNFKTNFVMRHQFSNVWLMSCGCFLSDSWFVARVLSLIGQWKGCYIGKAISYYKFLINNDWNFSN